MRWSLNRLAVFIFIVFAFGLLAACDQLGPPARPAALPPTTTPIFLPQETAVSRPESTPGVTVTATITPTATITRTARTYVTQPGDTLVSISSRFEVSIEEIAEANDLVNPNAILAGQTLIIPEEAVEETAVPPTSPPPPTNTPQPEATTDTEAGGGAPENLEPTGRLEITHPLAMVVAESGVITVEIIADPELATIGEHEPHVTGVVRIDASYNDGERAFYEQTIELFPLMSAELNAPAFEVFPSGGNNVRLSRVISTTLPAVWTWDIVATTPGEAQVVTVNLYKEPDVESGIPILTQSVSRNIRVAPKSRWNQVVDGLADNVLLLLGTGGPLGLALAYLTYRATKENERLKQEVADYETRQENSSTAEE